MTKTTRYAALLAASFCLAQDANAGRWLDQLRRTDLNDYAFGFTVSTAESPYLGASRSVVGYPYLTSFNHPTLTDDWLVVRDENIGVRFISASDWEYGLVARVQTVGGGAGSVPDRPLVELRPWSLETGLMAGWRGWPVQIQARAYVEVPNRHSGSTSEVEIAWPVNLDRGYVIPAVTLKHLTSGYAGYYYGVSEREASATRPQYQPGAALNTEVGVSFGYELSPQWLLQGGLSVEWLDSSISDSPIVDRERVLAARLGLAYNADLFQPREHDGSELRRSFEVRASVLSSSLETRVRHNGTSSAVADDVGFEDFLGASDRQSNLVGELYYRFGYYHRLEIGYLESLRKTQTILGNDLNFGDVSFPAGTDVTAGFDQRRLHVAYAYSLWRDNQKEFGFKAGITYNRLELAIEATDTGQRESVTVETPLPMVGVFAAVKTGRHWHLVGETSIFALDIDRYSGYSAHLRVAFDRMLADQVGIGIGYDIYGTRLETGEGDTYSLARTRNHGPRVYLSWYF